MKSATITILALLLLSGAPVASQEDPLPEARRAAELYRTGDTAGAVGILEQIPAEEMPPQAAAMLGALYLETGRSAEALERLAPLADGDAANPAVLYNAGRAALAVGERDRARSYLERSVELEPLSPASRELGILRAESREYLEAYVLLKPFADANPQDDEARLLAALCAVQLARPTEAEALLTGLQLQDERAQLLWGKVLILQSDPWGAISMLQPLLDNAPPAMQLDLRRTLAEAHVSVGQAAEAVELLEGRVGNDPDVALQLAEARYQSGELETALEVLRPFAQAAVAAERDISHPLIGEYGRLLIVDGRAEEALPFLEMATRTDPEDKQNWHQLGQAFATLGRQDEARAAMARFQELQQAEDPVSVQQARVDRSLEDPTGTRLAEAMALIAAERYQAAIAIAHEEAALAPADIRPGLVEARALLQSGRHDEALVVADRLVARASQSADTHYIRGSIHMAMGTLDAAERDLRAALERSAEHTAAMNDLAVLLIEKGQIDEARQLLERALELRPNDELAARNLAEITGG